MTADAGQVWQRLSPRMLLVHPVHEVLRQIPLLIGSVVLGSATGNPMWTLFGLGARSSGSAWPRWFTTTYRIDPTRCSCARVCCSARFFRCRATGFDRYPTDARLLHRLLGLDRAAGEHRPGGQGRRRVRARRGRAEQVPRLRAILLADSLAAGRATEREPSPGRVLARWQPSWLRYSPLSFTGLAMIAAAVGVVVSGGRRCGTAAFAACASPGCDAAERFGVVASVVVVGGRGAGRVGGAVGAAVAGDVRQPGAAPRCRCAAPRARPAAGARAHLRHAPAARRHAAGAAAGAAVRRRAAGRGDDGRRRRRGGVAAAAAVPRPHGGGGAVRLDRPAATWSPARCAAHGPAATRRRWTRALALPAVAAGRLVVACVSRRCRRCGLWPAWAVLALCCALLAADRSRALGHRVDDGWLVARAGSLERRRDCIAAAGIIGWTVRQTLLAAPGGGGDADRGDGGRGQALSGDRRSRRAGVVDRGGGVTVGRRQ